MMVVLSFWLPRAGAAPAAEGLEFFEKKVRPVLIERCYRCHSSQSEKLKGGLRLDSQAGLLKGGETGPVLNLEAPEKSRLLEAISYQNPDLQMPPKGKLPDQQIADLNAWVKMGVPWPDQAAAEQTAAPAKFDLEQRRQAHWAWQPIRKTTPPKVHSAAWPSGVVDRFLLAQLEKHQLHPAAPADRRTLLRRLCFDLTGLPPDAEQIERFISSGRPQDYAELIDELLASPHFGERWGRHWLDLVRYSETLGHEFDYPIQNAWRYRDYVIRAFNQDLPYDRFVLEHIAGDLLKPPRFHSTDHFNESIIGTAFFWLGQREHSPVDVRFHQAEIIDNQIDVLTKTFLGLTVACARCHDHKFDAISTRDYYALYGVMEGSRYAQRTIDSAADPKRQREKLQRLNAQLTEELTEFWLKQVEQISAGLLASTTAEKAEASEPEQRQRWRQALAQKELNEPAHILYPWFKLAHAATNSPAERQAAWQSLRAEAAARHSSNPASNLQVYAEAQGNVFPGWFSDPAETRDQAPFNLIIGTNSIFSVNEPAVRDSNFSKRRQRTLQSPTFEIQHRYLHVLAAGQDGRIKICVDNLTMLRDPIYGRLKQILKSDRFKWHTFDLEMWRGHRAFIELTDSLTADPTEDGQKDGYNENGYFAAKEVVFSDQPTPPSKALYVWEQLLATDDSLEALARAYQAAAKTGLRQWNQGNNDGLGVAESAFLSWLINNQLLAVSPRGAALLAQLQQLEAALPASERTPAMMDGNGVEEHVFIRGNHKTLGDLVPRRFLTALSPQSGAEFKRGSGRLELAQALIDPANPLVARVWVNRVWLHLFGRGLVATPDDFGVLGERPTHPELLDWLAEWFRTEAGWSTKKLIRLLLHSSAYRMASQASDANAEQKDPNNVWWHRMPMRRLEAESIRDAMLAVSGTLDRTMFGPPVRVHLTEFMDATGRPAESGPLDGAGRRSIYLDARRNFLPPMMRAFDSPTPLSTIGRRTSSNLPAQSLILLNDPFVLAQAEAWARRVLAEPGRSPEARVDQIYLAAFARHANANERTKALAFLNQQGSLEGLAPTECLTSQKVWTDLCHVVFNLKEFLFIE
jgi:cytochrome c553